MGKGTVLCNQDSVEAELIVSDYQWMETSGAIWMNNLQLFLGKLEARSQSFSESGESGPANAFIHFKAMRLILGYFLAVDFSQQQRALLISSLPASYFKQNECKVSLLFSLTPRTELWSPNEFIIRLVIFWALGVGLGDEGDAGAWNVWFGMGDGVTKWEGGDAPFLRLKLVTAHLWGQCTSERAGTEKNTQECSFLWCWDWAVRNSGPIATQNECKFQIGCPLAVLKTLLWQKTLSEVRIGLSVPSRLFASLLSLRLNHLPAMRSLFVWDISQIVIYRFFFISHIGIHPVHDFGLRERFCWWLPSSWISGCRNPAFQLIPVASAPSQ